MRVLVIEDGDVGRLGRTAALESAGHEVQACRWLELEGFGGLGPFDVVVAVLAPDRSAWDRYAMLPPLAKVVDGLTDTRVVGLLDGGAMANPVLRLRLVRAGVEAVVRGADVRSVDDMHRLVTDPAVTVPCRPSEIDLLAAGVTSGCDPDAVVGWVLERLDGPLSDAYRNAFEPGFTQNACGLTRRQAHTLRVRLSKLGRIRPNPGYSGGGPERDRSLPRWSEVVAVVNLCRGLRWDEGFGAGEGIGGQAYWRAA